MKLQLTHSGRRALCFKQRKVTSCSSIVYAESPRVCNAFDQGTLLYTVLQGL
jgi:hypothetical protein